VRGKIDAGYSKANIENVKIVLREKIKQVSTLGATNVEHDDVLLHDFGKGIASGQEDYF
jgi:hypothetical protein